MIGSHNAPNISVRSTSTASALFVEAIPDALRSSDSWVVRNGKVPYQARSPRFGASSTNPDHWSPLDIAVSTVSNGQAEGLGFVFAQSLGLVFIDLDDCFDEDGNLKPYAADIVAMFPTHWHLSMSGKGLHGICYGHIPKALKSKAAGVEMYSSERYMALPGDLQLWGDIAQVTDCSEAVTTLYDRLAKPTVAPLARPSLATVSLDTHDALNAMERSPRYRALLVGDATGYAGKSEARMALAGGCVFYHITNVEDIANVLLRSGLLDHHAEADRVRRARMDAEKAIQTDSGERYDPNYGRHASISLNVPTADDPAIAGLERDELLQMVRHQAAIIAEERARRVEAEQRAQRAERARSGIHAILRNGDLNAGPRLTAFALAMDLNARTANGEQPGVAGFRAPAARYAEATGQSIQTVAKHLRELDKKRLIKKTLVREETSMDDIDLDTGEIAVLPGKRDVNYIQVPDNDVLNLIERIATYRRSEGEGGQHGGAREPRPVCSEHPNAGTYTVKHEHVECAECHTVLSESETKPIYHPPDDPDALPSGIKLLPQNTGVVNTYSHIKLIPETPLMPRCDWNIGEGETCDEPTQQWDTGFGSTHLCERHASRARRSGSMHSAGRPTLLVGGKVSA